MTFGIWSSFTKTALYIKCERKKVCETLLTPKSVIRAVSKTPRFSQNIIYLERIPNILYSPIQSPRKVTYKSHLNYHCSLFAFPFLNYGIVIQVYRLCHMPNNPPLYLPKLILTVIVFSAKYFPIPTLSSLNISLRQQIYYAITTVLLFGRAVN